jgi:hypothetical protein
MVFDLEKNCSLHVDLAKSNSRSKRLRSDDASPYSPEKRTKRPMGFPDSGIIHVAFQTVCHERKPPVFPHLVDLCMMR